MNKDTIEKLTQLRLPGMLRAYQEQYKTDNIEDLTFEQRLTLMVDAEIDSRHNHTIERLIRNAQMSDKKASIEGIKYYADRQLNKDLIDELSSNQYIERGVTIHIIGATGSGKTYLACALGNAACLAEKKVMYTRLPDLLTDLALGREQGNYKNILKRYEKVDLLIIDEWLLIPANDIAQQHILEIVERRYGKKGTIFCSQFTTDSWHQRLGGGALADAILDRILSKSKTIQIHGNRSMRNR
ncbi:IS21-like element helper ATPase IstB [Faecalitalea cylindroides]|uniref:IS21-like element helper ATPase IstB n=1 Tax=Faecalitalea cylindroides TaxID=39483 RepID=UPI00189AA4F8|nr:IS21-like element helper ATPase IstB [Faecalitalea cylindroides]